MLKTSFVCTAKKKFFALPFPSQKDAKSKDDDILGDIMQELNSTPSSAPPRQTVSTLKRKALTPG